MKPLFLVSIALCIGAETVASQNTQAEDVMLIATQVCATCHARDGNSVSSLFPRLAGQPVAYLEAQLKSFRSHTRADPAAQSYMWGMASQLDDGTIHDLAEYYARQTPRPAAVEDSRLHALGKAIYEQGSPNHKIAACAPCHGVQAQGGGSNPRLAGQHPTYISRQLAFFKSRLRSNDPVMLSVCTEMTQEQMDAVAAYAASR